MKNLSENPHFQKLLSQRGLELCPAISAAMNLEEGTNIQIGNVRPEGTVIGFHLNAKDKEPPLLALVYDESKEGGKDALTIINCTF
jgi:hypothetical protein